MTAEIHVELLLYLFDVAAYVVMVNDAKHSPLAMTQVEVYVGIISEYGFFMSDV